MTHIQFVSEVKVRFVTDCDEKGTANDGIVVFDEPLTELTETELHQCLNAIKAQRAATKAADKAAPEIREEDEE